VFRYVGFLLSQKRFNEAISLAEAAVRLEEKPRPARATPSRIQENGSHTPMIEPRFNPPKILTQLGNLVEQLRRMKARQS
jgi:hypothetical protein